MMKAVLGLLVGFILVVPLVLNLAVKQGFAMPSVEQPIMWEPAIHAHDLVLEYGLIKKDYTLP